MQREAQKEAWRGAQKGVLREHRMQLLLATIDSAADNKELEV